MNTTHNIGRLGQFFMVFFLLFNNKLYFVCFGAHALGQWHMHNLLEREVVGELMYNEGV